MGRKNRIWFPGALYHITCRGNRKADIFKDREDYLNYLKVVEETKAKYPFGLIAYCLMTNHIHLQIRTNEIDTSKIMKLINQNYAKYFNHKHDYVGHLFQGRYFAELITDDEQMMLTSKYIHLNPVRAMMVKNPSEYEWSSYNVYIGNRNEEIIETGSILYRFNSRLLYREFVECDGEVESVG